MVAIIYTSGTSGEAKGVMLNAGNVGHMLGCTSGRLDQLMKKRPGQDSVFHYLPLCFAGSWIMMLTCLLRGSKLTLNTDLGKIAAEMRLACAGLFPECSRASRTHAQSRRRAALEDGWTSAEGVYQGQGRVGAAARGQSALRGRALARAGESARVSHHPKKMIGGKLRALICGSAPLSVETQLFFMMLGIPVLQVYGLTETTAI